MGCLSITRDIDFKPQRITVLTTLMCERTLCLFQPFEGEFLDTHKREWNHVV